MWLGRGHTRRPARVAIPCLSRGGPELAVVGRAQRGSLEVCQGLASAGSSAPQLTHFG